MFTHLMPVLPWGYWPLGSYWHNSAIQSLSTSPYIIHHQNTATSGYYNMIFKKKNRSSVVNNPPPMPHGILIAR